MSTIPFPSRRDEASLRALPALDLPGPRVWDASDLAAFFRFSVHWVRKVLRSDDPPPRVKGVRHLRFDTLDPKFQSWIARRLGHIDEVEGNG